MATLSWVNREYRRRLRTNPSWGPSVKYQPGGDVVSYPFHLGAARQEVKKPVAQGGVETQDLNDEFGGYYGVKPAGFSSGSVTGLVFFLKSVIDFRPCHIPLLSEPLNCDCTLSLY